LESIGGVEELPVPTAQPEVVEQIDSAIDPEHKA